MTLETLPPPLQKCVETVRERFVARHLNISSAVIEECALGILNAALEAGVAREGWWCDTLQKAITIHTGDT